jgi:hypothetical protein
MNYNCPQCGSSRTKALSLVYSGGTTEVRYNSFYIGTRRNFGYIPTFGRRQSMKAKLAAPPRRREWTLIGWPFLIGIAIAIVFVVLEGSLWHEDEAGIPDMQWWAAQGRGDWEQVLASDNEERAAELRASTYAGRPFGSKLFVSQPGEQFGRTWVRARPKKRGNVSPSPDPNQASLF